MDKPTKWEDYPYLNSLIIMGNNFSSAWHPSTKVHDVSLLGKS